MHQPLWIEGRDIQPGVKVLSGPFDVSQISHHVTREAKLTDSDQFCNARLIEIPFTVVSTLLQSVSPFQQP